MKGGRIPSEDLKGLKQKKHNAMPIANETKCCAGHQKKHKAMTTAKEMKQSRGKHKKHKATTTVPEEVPDLSEQADDTGPFPPDESTLSGLRDSTSSLFGNSDLDDASDDDSEEASHGDDEHIVYADFEFFDPKPDDFHGVRNLLKTYCDGKEWDLNGFVDIILAQTTVGSIIKTDGDSLFGVITALNLARYKDQRCIIQLQEFLLDKCLEKPEAIEFKAFWGKHPHDVGLLVSERVVNLPFELVPPLYDGLLDEVSWAIEDEPTEALRCSFQFKHYLLLTRVYQTIPKGRKMENMKNRKRKKGSSSQNGGHPSLKDGNEQLIYIKPEDEIFHKLSSWSFTFPTNAEYLATHELKDLRPMRLLMAVKVEKMQTFRTQLKALLDES
eukprot:Gb_25749 [translate_table: standard]